jgi:1,4-dihydroxy-6-naphthoate synthase
VSQGKLSIAFSPCPNDTFVFHALVHGLVPGAPEFDVTFADVDVTNSAARLGTFDLVKVSYAALPSLTDQYELLPCGGALGRGCGPLVLVHPDRQRSVTEGGKGLSGLRVAVPGKLTTAYLLMRLWSREAPPASVTVVPFSEIMPAVAAGRYDAGLVIHEARFTYQRYQLRALADLGEWWEATTGLPIPLGAILARRATTDVTAATEWVRASVRYAMAHPLASQDFVLSHAQEMDPDVVRRHIELYVNQYTVDLGEEGLAAVSTLLRHCPS